MKTFNPNRLQFARLRRGFSQAALAEAVGVTTRSMYTYENGLHEPNIELLAKVLDFPKDFFYEDDLPQIPDHGASFRSMSKMSAKLKNIALSYGALAFLLNDWFESEFDMPDANLPDLSDLEPEDAAISLRQTWGIGEAPIANMIGLLESKGIRVFSLAIEAKEVDAFSVWYKNKPFIFLNTMKSAERSRFDAAHELAHLVRDIHSMKHDASEEVVEVQNTRDIERQADAFASAFLMPKNNIIAHKANFVSVNTLMAQKKIWGVSITALAYRMYKLEIISEWVYTRILCPEIAQKGYRSKEPAPMVHEKSIVLQKILRSLNEDNISINEIAEKIKVSPKDISSLTFGLENIPLLLIK